MKQDEIMELEKESCIVCDTDGDKGLSWEEVDNCEVLKNGDLEYSFSWLSFQYLFQIMKAKYGLFLDMESLDHLPNKEDFDTFDTDKDGILFFEEWENANE